MNRYFLTHRKTDVALLIGAAFAVPLVYGVVRLPIEAAIVLGGVYATRLLWAGLAVARLALVTPGRGARILPSRGAPYSLAGVGASGACPRGLTVGDRIAVDDTGFPSVALCRVAVEALGRAGIAARASCVCPLEEQPVWFAATAS